VLTRPDDLPTSIALHQQFSIKEIDPHWLPAAYRPVEINLNAARVVPDSLTLLVDSSQPIGNVVYDVDSYIPVPSQEDLASAPPDPEGMREDLELPSDFPQSVINLAQQVTEGQDGPYGKALALTQFFRRPATSPTRPKPTSTTRPTRSCSSSMSAKVSASNSRPRSRPWPDRSAYRRRRCGRLPTGHVGNRRLFTSPIATRTRGRKCGSRRGWIPFEPTPAFSEPTLGLGTGGPKERRHPRPRRRPPPVSPDFRGDVSRLFSRHSRGARSRAAAGQEGGSSQRVGHRSCRRVGRLGRGRVRRAGAARHRRVLTLAPQLSAPQTTGIFANACSARGPRRSRCCEPRVSPCDPRHPRWSSRYAMRRARRR
jgi:hypothetical protein